MNTHTVKSNFQSFAPTRRHNLTLWLDAFLLSWLIVMGSCSVGQCPEVRDLDDAYHTILLHHPGPHNKDDPHFLKTLEHAYSKAKEGLQRASRAQYDRTVLTQFTDAFEDPHLGIRWSDQHTSSQTHSQQQMFSVERFGTGLWVRLPTFYVHKQNITSFQRVITRLSRRQSASHIIFDLRGNQGGNSDFGSRIINAVFGTSYASQKRCEANKEVMVSWRVSQENLNHIVKLHQQYPDQVWLLNVSKGLANAQKRGQALYQEYPFSSCGAAKRGRTTPNNHFKTFIVIDSVNVSAALDFIDEVKMMTANVVLIGQQTKADRTYMEVRTQPLPSAKGHMFFPIKVYHHRPRRDKQAYKPDIAFHPIHETLKLKQFLSTIMRQ